MFEVRVFSRLLSWLWLTSAIFSTTIYATTTSTHIAKLGCPTRHGKVTIPYPFGIGLDGACSIGNLYNINCNTSFNPSKPFYGSTNLEIVDISKTHQLRSKNNVASQCYQGGVLATTENNNRFINVSLTPLVISDTANEFIVIGCDDVGVSNGTDSEGLFTTGACVVTCFSLEHVLKYNGSCSGFGCCQTPVSKGLKMFVASVAGLTNHSGVSDYNQCGHAFIAEKDKFTFNVADLSDPTFRTRTNNDVPLVYEWFVGFNETCHLAQQNLSSYACQHNSKCTDIDIGPTGGYRCTCLDGCEGNPYLPPGCTDVNECSAPNSPCSDHCSNTPGGYICTCPRGYDGDGLKNGTRCTLKSQFVTWFSLGMSFGFLFLLMLVSWIYFVIRRNKLKVKRENFFGQNGGLLLKELLLQNGETTESSKIFSAKELRIATKNYSEDRILGKGGFGMVHKGILKDGSEVAIKKSKLVDQNESQLKQFISEVIILTQVKHRNVVKLIGCCLETEVPLLVYEFISNGTLFEHIHKKGGTSWLNWVNCVRVAAEAANALAYLHSAVSTPILHRDVKSANILVDESLTAKIADFGASRPATIDQLQVGTFITTAGYTDPEAYQTYQLTEKSDVYSFGVVLAELMTKEKATFSEKKMGEDQFVYLAGYFVMAMKSGRLIEILDPQLVSDASINEQLVNMANLVKRCLNLKGEDRPTMKEVALELEGLQNPNWHPWAEQNYEGSSLVVRQTDLYPVPSINSHSNSHTRTTEISYQYSVQNEPTSSVLEPR